MSTHINTNNAATELPSNDKRFHKIWIIESIRIQPGARPRLNVMYIPNKWTDIKIPEDAEIALAQNVFVISATNDNNDVLHAFYAVQAAKYGDSPTSMKRAIMKLARLVWEHPDNPVLNG